MKTSAQAEALFQVARKRQILDHPGCARLKMLIQRAGVQTAGEAREFCARAGLLPPPIARRLLQALPGAEQPPFGDYRPLVHLADGGMGSAWLAANAVEQLVVIKTMRGNLAENLEVRARFEREVRIMQEFVHPHVVQCLDSGSSSDGGLFMTLEFVDGGDVKDLIDAQGALPEALGLSMIYQIADALVLAEEHRLVHRDIKPANIFATEQGHAKLADFGIARSTTTERTQLTMQGAMVGSPYFMSPEQVRADVELTTASDIYALGAVLYACLAGTEPYRGALQEVLHAHCTAPVPDIRVLQPNITHATSSIITRCMQKDVQDRYPSALAMRDAIGNALADLERHAPLSQDETARIVRQRDVSSEQETMVTAAGGGGGATITMDLDDDATMAADLNDLNDATIAADLNDGGVTVAADLNHAPTSASSQMQTQFRDAMKDRWIVLSGNGIRVVLVAKRLVVAGKLCEPPVDMCLRMYPTVQYREECLRVSRQHLRFEFQQHAGVQVTDLGSGNGTELDGKRLDANAPTLLKDRHQLRVAGVLDLEAKVIPRSGTETWTIDGAPPSTGDFGCGIEIGHSVDALVLQRARNEAQMAYAMVLRQVSVGGTGAEIELPGCAAKAQAEVGLYGGRWITRMSSAEAWRGLAKGEVIDIGGLTLTATAGDYAIFD